METISSRISQHSSPPNQILATPLTAPAWYRIKSRAREKETEIDNVSIGSRAFPVVASRPWNFLPPHNVAPVSSLFCINVWRHVVSSAVRSSNLLLCARTYFVILDAITYQVTSQIRLHLEFTFHIFHIHTRYLQPLGLVDYGFLKKSIWRYLKTIFEAVHWWHANIIFR